MLNQPKPIKSNIPKSSLKNDSYLESNLFFDQNEKFYYSKYFQIQSQTERYFYNLRQKLSIKNIPYFKILQFFKNKIKVQMKKYSTKALQRLSALTLSSKISTIRQLFTSFVQLVEIYGVFSLCEKSFKIDEFGKFIIWICEDYQKQQFSVDTLKKYSSHHKLRRQDSMYCCKQFLKVVGHLLPHKKIRQHIQMTCQQLQQILYQIQRKNQIHIKCHDILKHKGKQKHVRRVTSLNKAIQQRAHRESNKKLLKKSMNNFEECAQSRLKRYTSSNFGLSEIQTTKRLSFPCTNVNIFDYTSQNKVCCQQRWSHLQNRFNSPKFIINKHQNYINKNNQSDKKQIKHKEKVPKFLLRKNNPNPESDSSKNQTQKIFTIEKKQINRNNITSQEVKTFDIIKFYKHKSDDSRNEKIVQEKFNLRSNPIQIVHPDNLKVNILDIKFTSSITSDCEKKMNQAVKSNLDQENNCKKNTILTNIKSCQNLSNNCNPIFQNSTSTAPSLKNCQSQEYFFLSKLNPLQQMRIQQELNQMFSSRQRKVSAYMQDDEQFQELKQQLGDLLN